jgi:LysM repeat protein
MKALLLAIALAAAPASQVAVQPGDTLAEIARRTLGDANAASELAALNHLGTNEAKPGTVLTLPGPDRALAQSAITAAKNAIAQAKNDAQRPLAVKKLAEAEALFAQARYQDAAAAADSAWKLLASQADAATRFEVKVGEDGATEVASQSGRPVRVEAQGKTVGVAPGHKVKVKKGEPPATEAAPPRPPALLSPKDRALLTFREAKRLGPVKLRWEKVTGAERYEVVVTSASGPAFNATVKQAWVVVPPMPPGTYEWTVRAIAAGGIASEKVARRFELKPKGLKLEVHETKWK